MIEDFKLAQDNKYDLLALQSPDFSTIISEYLEFAPPGNRPFLNPRCIGLLTSMID